MDTTQAFTVIAQAMNDFINTLPLSARAGTNQYLQEAVNALQRVVTEAQAPKITATQVAPPKPKNAPVK